MPHLHSGQHNGKVARAVAELGHKAAINFQFADRQLADVRERGVAGAIVVERYANADLLQRTQGVRCRVEIVEQRALGNFKAQQRRLDPAPGQPFSDKAREAFVLQVAR